MNKIKCLIVDDEPISQRIILKYLEDLSDFEVVGTCLHALAAQKVLEEQEVDLMFLDIEMPKLKGIDFVKTLQNPPEIIFITAHREYALEGFELNAVDYMQKPISFDRFLKGINKYKKLKSVPKDNPAKESKVLYVKSERKTLKIQEPDIIYIEGMNNYISLQCVDQRHMVYMTLGNVLKLLSSQFVRIHKSFVINKDHIIAFTKDNVELTGKTLPIGKSYKGVEGEF